MESNHSAKNFLFLLSCTLILEVLYNVELQCTRLCSKPFPDFFFLLTFLIGFIGIFVVCCCIFTRGLALLPKILSVIALEETVSYGESSLNGEKYKSHVINSLCSCKYAQILYQYSLKNLERIYKDKFPSLNGEI